MLKHPDNTSQLPLEAYDESFAAIIGENPKLFHIATGFGFTEGPIYFSESKGSDAGYLFFTDQVHDNINMIKWNGQDPFNTISDYSFCPPAILRHPSSVANGQTADLQGRLITAETTGRRISVTKATGEIRTLISLHEGKPLNSPNDLVVKSDGTVWFTDPTYGQLQFPQESYHGANVYRFDPTSNELTAIVTELEMPNGIAFSPDEKQLYIADSASIQWAPTNYEYLPHAIYKYDVTEKGVKNQQLFATISPGFPDGMRLDSQGNVYVGAFDGVQVLNPAGKLIGKIRLPKQTANLTFGGKDNNILFICSSNSIWAIKLNTKGAVPIQVMAK